MGNFSEQVWGVSDERHHSILTRPEPVQVNSCTHDTHDGNDGPDVPSHRGIPQSQLQCIQPGVLQVTKGGHGFSGLLPEGLGNHVVCRAATCVAELIVRLPESVSTPTEVPPPVGS